MVFLSQPGARPDSPRRLHCTLYNVISDDESDEADRDVESSARHCNAERCPTAPMHLILLAMAATIVGLAFALISERSANSTIKNSSACVREEIGRKSPVLAMGSHQGLSHSVQVDEDGTYDGPSRAFQPWDRTKPFPCFDFITYTNNSQRRDQEGLFYVKVPKTASSTVSGVALRIARRKSHLLRNGGSTCNVEEAHGLAQGHFHYERRDRDRSFLWSVVREPTARAVSYFFYNHVSRKREDPTDKNFMKWVSRSDDHIDNYQLNYLTLRKGGNQTAVESVEGILDEYNFVGVTERLDESLVALRMLLGLDVWDVLYTSSKLSGGFAYVHNGKNPHCVYEVPKFVSPAMAAYFASREWRDRVAGDALLHRAANASLDRTIDALGRERFESELRRFREVMSAANERCASEVVYPCTPGGELVVEDANCYKEDKGCGYPCLDRLSTELAT